MSDRTTGSPAIPGILIRYQQSYSNLPRSAWVVAAIVLVHNSGRMVSTFLAVYLFTVLSLSENWIGVAVTAYGSGAVLGSLVGGWLTARLCAKYLILTSLFSVGLGYICLAATRDPHGFVLLLFTSAIFDGMLRPAIMLVLMGAAAPQDRTRCYALYQTSLNLGYAVGAVGGGILAELYFPLVFWVNGATSILAGIVLIFAMPPGGSPGVSLVSTPGPTGKPTSRNWPLLLLCSAGFLYYCVANQRLSIYPLYLTTDYGLRPFALGTLLMFNGLLTVATSVLITDRLKGIDQRLVAGAGALCMCGSFAMLPAGESLAFAFFLCIILTLGEILFLPSIVTLVYGWSRSETAGRSMGLFFAVSTACRALGPVAGVWSFSVLGPGVTWLSCGAAGILAAILLIALPRQHAKNES